MPAWAFSRIAGRVMGTEPPAVFTTLGRARGTYWGWLHFAARLMPFGHLPRREAEMVILTVATTSGCDYEREHHRRLGRRAGLSTAEIEDLCGGTAVGSWSDREEAMRDSAVELVGTGDLSDGTWARLAAHLSERERVEFLLLVGHYEMLATTLTTLRIPPDAGRNART